MPTSRTIRLWDGSGNLLATATTTAEVDGWNTSGPLNTGNLTIPAGTYTISYTVDASGYYTTNGSGLIYGSQVNGITIVAPYHNGSPTPSYPNIVMSAFNLTAVDLSIITFVDVPLTLVGTQTNSNSSLVGSASGIPRTIFGVFSPVPSTVTQISGSYGLISASYLNAGQYQFTFTNAFNYIPAITVTIIQPDSTITENHIAYLSELTTTTFKVYILEPSGPTYANFDFTLVVIGI